MKNRIVQVLAACACVLAVSVLVPRPSVNTLTVGSREFAVEYATTAEAQTRGLSGRQSLPQDSAMVFVFSAEGQRCFWMKDMNFAIDMVWLDSKKRVIALEQNVQPDSYPDSYCHDGAQYVVEFAADMADQLRLNPGEVFEF